MRHNLNTVTYTGVEARPDVATYARIVRLAGAGLAPQRGRDEIVGYDRGDPAYTLGGPVAGARDPAVIAGAPAPAGNIYQPTATFQDAGINDPQLAPLAALQYARMVAAQ